MKPGEALTHLDVSLDVFQNIDENCRLSKQAKELLLQVRLDTLKLQQLIARQKNQMTGDKNV